MGRTRTSQDKGRARVGQERAGDSWKNQSTTKGKGTKEMIKKWQHEGRMAHGKGKARRDKRRLGQEEESGNLLVHLTEQP